MHRIIRDIKIRSKKSTMSRNTSTTAFEQGAHPCARGLLVLEAAWHKLGRSEWLHPRGVRSSDSGHARSLELKRTRNRDGSKQRPPSRGIVSSGLGNDTRHKNHTYILYKRTSSVAHALHMDGKFWDQGIRTASASLGCHDSSLSRADNHAE